MCSSSVTNTGLSCTSQTDRAYHFLIPCLQPHLMEKKHCRFRSDSDRCLSIPTHTLGIKATPLYAGMSLRTEDVQRPRSSTALQADTTRSSKGHLPNWCFPIHSDRHCCSLFDYLCSLIPLFSGHWPVHSHMPVLTSFQRCRHIFVPIRIGAMVLNFQFSSDQSEFHPHLTWLLLLTPRAAMTVIGARRV